MKLIEIKRGSDLLQEAIEHTSRANPKTFCIVYQDPQDGKLTIHADGHNLNEQVGMLFRASLLIQNAL